MKYREAVMWSLVFVSVLTFAASFKWTPAALITNLAWLLLSIDLLLANQKPRRAKDSFLESMQRLWWRRAAIVSIVTWFISAYLHGLYSRTVALNSAFIGATVFHLIGSAHYLVARRRIHSVS